MTGTYKRPNYRKMPDFEYRIDRRPRLLRRIDMFPNPYHPSGRPVRSDLGVCNSVHAHNLRAGLEWLSPGAEREFGPFLNEHILLGISGELVSRVQGTTYTFLPGDHLFSPAFESYYFRNDGPVDAWFLSCYIRNDTWEGGPPAETVVAAGCDQHRYLSLTEQLKPAPVAPYPGVHRWSSVSGTNVRASRLSIQPQAALPPQHSMHEQLLIVESGPLSARVDSIECELASQDLMFIPAMVPFAFNNAGKDECRVMFYEIKLDEW